MIELIARSFRSMGEPYRLRLLQVLESGEKTVGELVKAVDGNQPNVSKHLQILYSAGIVTRHRQGNSIHYAIGDPMVLKLCRMVCKDTADRSREEHEDLNNQLVRPAKARRR